MWKFPKRYGVILGMIPVDIGVVSQAFWLTPAFDTIAILE